jgi:hypothetical protein
MVNRWIILFEKTDYVYWLPFVSSGIQREVMGYYRGRPVIFDIFIGWLIGQIHIQYFRNIKKRRGL